MRKTAVFPTSGLRSDVTIMFFDLDFFQNAKISAIHIHLRHYRIIYAWTFRTS